MEKEWKRSNLEAFLGKCDYFLMAVFLIFPSASLLKYNWYRKKLYITNACNLVSLNTGIHSCHHCYNPGNKHTHYLQNFPVSLFGVVCFVVETTKMIFALLINYLLDTTHQKSKEKQKYLSRTTSH